MEGVSLFDTPSIIYTERFLREVMVWRKHSGVYKQREVFHS